MGLDEGGARIADVVLAELVDCTPPEVLPDTPQPVAPESSPTARAAEATIEQTGADPPPAVTCG